MAKTQTIVRRAAPTVPKKKFELALRARAAAGKKAREVAAKRTGTIVGALAGAGVGYCERTGKVAPKYVSPVALAVAGGVLAFVLPETSIGRGKVGAASAEAGAGLLAVAGYKLGMGQAAIGEDDTEMAGDWTPDSGL